MGEIDARLFVKRNASTILTVLGSIGVVATSITAVKAISKALQLIEKARQEKGEELTKWETVKITSPSYISTAGLCLATMIYIIGAEILNQKKRQASLLSACVLLVQSYKDYRSILNSHKLHCL